MVPCHQPCLLDTRARIWLATFLPSSQILPTNLNLFNYHVCSFEVCPISHLLPLKLKRDTDRQAERLKGRGIRATEHVTCVLSIRIEPQRTKLGDHLWGGDISLFCGLDTHHRPSSSYAVSTEKTCESSRIFKYSLRIDPQPSQECGLQS